MFAKSPRLRWNRFLIPPIHRNQWKLRDNCPLTNTQQGARLLRPSPRYSNKLWALPTSIFARIVRFWIKTQPFDQAFPAIKRFRLSGPE
jgi:hypothetical protein